MVRLNPRLELTTFTPTRDVRPYGGMDGYNAALALAFSPEVADAPPADAGIYERRPFSDDDLRAAADDNQRKTMRRENQAWDRLARFHRCSTTLRGATPPVDPVNVVHVPALTIAAWNALAPINHAKNLGPRQAWWEWYVSVTAKADRRITDYINAILLHETLESEVPTDLRALGIPTEAMAAIKAGLLQLKQARQRVQALTSDATFRESSRAQREERLRPLVGGLQTLPSIVRIIGASTELLTEAQRRNFDARSRSVTKYPGALVTGTPARPVNARDVAQEVKDAITAARAARITIWVTGWRDRVEVDIEVPTLTP